MNGLNSKTLVHELNRALTENEFFLHYQPIFDTSTKLLSSFEALIRWQHPTLGIQGAGTFIPFAEDINLTQKIDAWVIQTVCHQIRHWKEQGLVAPAISVNVTPQSIAESDFDAWLLKTIRYFELQPQNLTLEITERKDLPNQSDIISRLHRLRQLGFGLAIDDFGVDHASFRRLIQIPASQIKIDRLFVKDIKTCKISQEIVRSVVMLANRLNMKTVAEGIEDQETLSIITHLGCHGSQGFFLARPMPATGHEHLLSVLSENSSIPVRAAA